MHTGPPIHHTSAPSGVDVLVFATMTSVVVELALEEAFSFSCSDDEESAFPMTHQLPCFLGIGRSVIGGFVVCAFGFGLGGETEIKNRIQRRSVDPCAQKRTPQILHSNLKLLPAPDVLLIRHLLHDGAKLLEPFSRTSAHEVHANAMPIVFGHFARLAAILDGLQKCDRVIRPVSFKGGRRGFLVGVPGAVELA